MTLTSTDRCKKDDRVGGVHPMTLFRRWIILVAVIGGVCRCDDVIVTKVEVSAERSAVHAGENVTLICRVSGPPEGAVLQWRKSTVSGDYGSEETVAENDALTEVYSTYAGRRLHVDLVPLPDVIFYMLHIYLIQHEDSGLYRCSVLRTAHTDSVGLQVYRRPEEVYFEDYAEGAELTAVEDVPMSITCRVRRVLPQPHVSIHVHDRSVGGHLPANVSVNVQCRPQQSGGGRVQTKNCPVHYDLDVVVTAPQLIVGYRDDGQRIRCTVGLSRSNWTPVETSLNLNVLYRPRFNCSHAQYAQLQASDVIIRCRVRYNPRPSLLSVRWRHKGDDVNETTLEVGSAIADAYRLDETVIDTKSFKETEMIFVIGNVRHRDFVDYHFEATNDVGSATHAVHLIQYHPPPTTTEKIRTSAARRPTDVDTSANALYSVATSLSTNSPNICMLLITCLTCLTRSIFVQ